MRTVSSSNRPTGLTNAGTLSDLRAIELSLIDDLGKVFIGLSGSQQCFQADHGGNGSMIGHHSGPFGVPGNFFFFAMACWVISSQPKYQ